MTAEIKALLEEIAPVLDELVQARVDAAVTRAIQAEYVKRLEARNAELEARHAELVERARLAAS